MAQELDVVELYNDLHKTPELGFQEFKTSAYIAQKLKEMGYEVTTGVGKTGVVAVEKGGEKGPCVMIRADMDALPFKINGEDKLFLDDFLPELKKIRERGLEMVCANPDLRANEGGKFVVRQGLICDAFEKMGGKTVIYGKPDPQIFERALRDFADVPKSQVLMVGGIFGEIVSVKDDQFVVKIADNVKINVVKTAVSTVVGKEEQK